MEWKRTSDVVPPNGMVVIGWWEENAMKCYRKDTQWIDVFHNCKCFMPPLFWIEEPNDYVKD